MWNNYFTLLSGFLLSISLGTGSTTSAIQIDRQYPLGTIGCLFDDGLCDPGATCIDDLLFGTCSHNGVPSSFAYTLDQHDLEKLYEEIIKLVRDFSWSDSYTQCIIQNVIVSLSIREPFSKRICTELVFDYTDSVDNEIETVLGELLSRTAGSDNENPVSKYGVALLAPSQKRDEIIQVHKYFDKNKKIHKRKYPQPDLSYSNYLSALPRNEYREIAPVPYYVNDGPYQIYDGPYVPSYENFDTQGGLENFEIPYEELALVKSYLDSEREKQLYKSKLSELFSILPGTYQQYENNPGYGLAQMQEPEYRWIDDNDEFALQSPEESIELDDPFINSLELPDDENMIVGDNTDDDYSLPPELANTLDKLIRGEMEAENLTDDELNYLTPYVTKMLLRLSDVNKQQDKDEAMSDPDIWREEAMQSESLPDEDDDDDDDDDDDGDTAVQPFGVDEEDMMKRIDIHSNNANNADVDNEENVDTAASEATTAQPGDVINTNIAYVEFDKPLSSNDANAVVDRLEELANAKHGTLLLEDPTSENKVEIFVDADLAGVNASYIADLAKNKKSELEALTQKTFKDSGIGGGTVEVSSVDNRYFDITFILCGCIAGILIAVVVIYLFRRNSRSKEKLQQITSTQEGNEAASKDYQDLCRQRMQSKSSEKPEPLHTAASRVSSVSEAQVRSPSSRSSTSSWSEEPVNSNMDISTGHIVLSYMEDHLKNKDRLEREWEAMCAYEADPCSTKVAEDVTNTRKNRYADVLPYDHSRVVLSTNTNVSGSDYINASTITDHDPRNPAYVASQGPLPHTVADFWQMVWEQGSVVIVMLTKLTENGEAKCHRYWPEEGSDLYHIYEVHLVSEHIWCEDYLVRSFYLKNLQTGETRTVTQFHFLTWPDLGIPSSIKALLDFRRKVNKSYRGRSCPITVHCSDGCGRTGTYCLVDMVLNRMAKGAKEIDIAATLEHIRDQRINMVKTKEQFQFALAAVAEEVHAILKALPQ